MITSHHGLPLARRTNDELGRYVRAEYRENDPCWFASGAAKASCLRLPGERAVTELAVATPTASAPTAPVARACPVMSTVSDTRIVPELAMRGEPVGDL